MRVASLAPALVVEHKRGRVDRHAQAPVRNARAKIDILETVDESFVERARLHEKCGGNDEAGPRYDLEEAPFFGERGCEGNPLVQVPHLHEGADENAEMLHS